MPICSSCYSPLLPPCYSTSAEPNSLFHCFFCCFASAALTLSATLRLCVFSFSYCHLPGAGLAFSLPFAVLLPLALFVLICPAPRLVVRFYPLFPFTCIFTLPLTTLSHQIQELTASVASLRSETAEKSKQLASLQASNGELKSSLAQVCSPRTPILASGFLLLYAFCLAAFLVALP